MNRRLHSATVIWTKDLAFVWKGAIVTVGLMVLHSPRPASSLFGCVKYDSGVRLVRLHLFTLALEPEIVNCQVGHVKCFVRKSSELKKRNQKYVSWYVD